MSFEGALDAVVWVLPCSLGCCVFLSLRSCSRCSHSRRGGHFVCTASLSLHASMLLLAACVNVSLSLHASNRPAVKGLSCHASTTTVHCN